MMDQPSASTEPKKRPLSTGRIIGLGILLGVIVLLASCVYRIAAPLATPNLFGLDRKLASMPCVTWVDSDPRGGNIAVRGPVVYYRIGVSPNCTAAEVENILWTMHEGVDETGAALEDWALFVADRDESRFVLYSDTLAVGMLSGQDDLSREEFQFVASNWVRLQHEVDPKSQLYSRNEYDGDTDEFELKVGLHLNLSPEELDRAPSIIPAELDSKTTYWKITTPTTGAVSDRANDTTAGRVLFDTLGQLPDKELIGLGRAAGTAWQGDTPDGTYVTVSSGLRQPSYEPEGLIKMMVYNVSDSHVTPFNTEIPQQPPRPLDQTTLWPHLTATIDRLDATGQEFTLGIGLASRTREENGNTGGEINLHLSTNSCTLLPDDPWKALEQPLYDYWLSPQRLRLPESSASKYCPAAASTATAGS